LSQVLLCDLSLPVDPPLTPRWFPQGESSWQPPESWKIRPSEMWVRNKDDRDNIYYYNMQVRLH